MYKEAHHDNLLVLLQHREDGRELGIDVEHAPPVPRISRDVNVRPPLISGESASLHRRDDLEPRFESPVFQDERGSSDQFSATATPRSG